MLSAAAANAAAESKHPSLPESIVILRRPLLAPKDLSEPRQASRVLRRIKARWARFLISGAIMSKRLASKLYFPSSEKLGGTIKMAHELPPLPYAYDALDSTIDKQTMTLHHDMHHGAYVKNLNAAIEKHPNLAGKTAEDLIRDLNAIPEDIRGAVRNNGGGHVNHTMFWKIMKPQGGGDPSGPIADVIQKTFGNFNDFKTKFNDAGTKQFGSGWVWLAGKPGGEVQIISTPNQDNPISQGLYPIFGNDVWEHAYYLKYNNRRPNISRHGGTSSTGTRLTSATRHPNPEPTNRPWPTDSIPSLRLSS